MNLFGRAFALVALAPLLSICACSGASQGASAVPDSAAAAAVGSPAASGFKCFTPAVFKPLWAGNFGAINDLGEIPGSYSPASSETYDFIIHRPYKELHGLLLPGTTITAVTDNKISVGYLIDPPPLRGVWGFVRIGSGIWTLLNNPKEGSGPFAVTELLGANDRGAAVGFYYNRRGTQVAFAIGVGNEKSVDLNPPGSSGAYATGINSDGTVVGTASTPSGIVGFTFKHAVYNEFSYPKSLQTEALGINAFGEIVGDYTDASGGVHGFFVTDPGGDPKWRSFDEQYAAGYTVLTGINRHGDFDGDYVNEAGIERPFLCAVSS